MLNRSDVMRRAWALYRTSAYARGPFDRFAFGRALSMAWTAARLAAERAAQEARWAAERDMPEPEVDEAETALPSPLAEALAGLSYLPFHMSAARAEAAIRARFAAQGITA